MNFSLTSRFIRKLRGIDVDFELVNFIWAMTCCNVMLLVLWGIS